MKKVLSLFLSVLMLTGVVAAVDLSSYADTVASGSCGTNLTWEINDEGTLTISGSGDMYSYDYQFSNSTWTKNYSDIIKSVVISEGVTNIGTSIFYNCSNITNVTIPSTVTFIGAYAFYYCTGLLSINIPDNVTYIDKSAFARCENLESVIIGNGITEINKQVFDHCSSLTNVVISDSVTSIGDYAFSHCTSLVNISLPTQLETLGQFAFEYCENLVSITIPDSVTSIGDYAFSHCTSLVNISLPTQLETLGQFAFEYCENLVSITIPDSVISIGYTAFLKCTGITDVYYGGSICDWYTIINVNAVELDYATIHYTGNSEHSWNSGKITKESTCTEKGEKTYTCTTCGATMAENINAKGHNWDNGNITTEPSCSSVGILTYTCNTCGVTKKENIDKIAHSYDGGTVTKEATCKAAGTKTYTCTVCGSTKKETIDKLTTHSYENKITKAKYDSNGGSNGKIEKKCSVCKNVKSTTTIYKPKSMSLSTTSYTYNGKAKKPTITVKDSKGNKISSKYYTVSYISRSTGKKVSSMKNPGKYYVKVTFKTRYSGSIKKAVTIKPKKTSIKKITASKKGFTVKWSKVSTQNTGYQIQYSTSKSFKSPKTVTVKKTGTTSKKVSKLKAKKKYYVRVRTYKTVKINGKNTKIYSPWSSVKGVTTKK